MTDLDVEGRAGLRRHGFRSWIEAPLLRCSVLVHPPMRPGGPLSAGEPVRGRRAAPTDPRLVEGVAGAVDQVEFGLGPGPVQVPGGDAPGVAMS